MSEKFLTTKLSTPALAAVVLFVLFGSLGNLGWSYDGKPAPLSASEKPKDFEGIGITEKLSTQLDLNWQFKDENGQLVPLSKYYDGSHPVVISLMYYACPGLCSFHFNGVIDALKEVDWNPGEKFRVLAISFDSKEGSDLAAQKRASYLEVYGRPSGQNGIHFLTADEETVQKLTKAVGFEYKWNEQAKEWAHASAAIVTTPSGVVSRYLHGIMFDPKTFKLALNEATMGKIGTIVDKMVWYCFKYDPSQSKYTLVAFRLVQIGAAAITVVLMLILLPFWVRSRRGKKV